MRDAHQVFWIILVALASIALIIGGVSISLVEDNMLVVTATPLPTSTLPIPPTPSPVDSPTPPISTITRTPASTPSSSPSPVVTQPDIWTPTISPSPSICPTPSGWSYYTVRSGDTIEALATRFHLTTYEISQGNCLATTVLFPGQVLSMPPVPTSTPVPCGAPRNWIIYLVQPGDTLYHLGQLYGIPFTDIQRANCLAGTTIHIGQSLYVPPWAPCLPTAVFPEILIPIFYVPSETPFATSTGMTIDTTPSSEITETITPTETDTPTPSCTPTPTDPTSDP
jgi:LysM repeat protein